MKFDQQTVIFNKENALENVYKMVLNVVNIMSG